MTTIKLTIRFNQPFRVSAGHGAGDVDDVIDRTNPLPATSLKGVLRDAARLLLPGTTEGDSYIDHPLVREVFGSRGGHDPAWHFSDATFDNAADDSYRPRTRVSIDEHRRARPGALYVGEELHVTEATAEISQIGQIREEQKPRHLALLHLSARLVDGLGADRRRGLGWVSISTEADEKEIHDMVNTVVRSQS